jgi:hypothetical protein
MANMRIAALTAIEHRLVIIKWLDGHKNHTAI